MAQSNHINVPSINALSDGERDREVKGDQVIARECYMVSLKGELSSSKENMLIEGLEARGERAQVAAEPLGDLENIILNTDIPDRTTRVGADLLKEYRTRLRNFLIENWDVFAWTHKDMPRIDPRVVVHKLNMNPASRPIKQKKRNFTPEHNQAVTEEVEKLLAAGFVRKVYYPDWLANVVMV